MSHGRQYASVLRPMTRLRSRYHTWAPHILRQEERRVPAGGGRDQIYLSIYPVIYYLYIYLHWHIYIYISLSLSMLYLNTHSYVHMMTCLFRAQRHADVQRPMPGKREARRESFARMIYSYLFARALGHRFANQSEDFAGPQTPT